MASMVTKPPVASTAMPMRAAPLVHPRAIVAPYSKSMPPIRAQKRRLRVVIFGECSTLNFRRPDKAPEINPPMRIPNTSKFNQSLSGPPGLSTYFAQKPD